ncbi:MAG: phosphatase PAP2 family protein [Candidatus Methanomethylicia archaeon]
MLHVNYLDLFWTAITLLGDYRLYTILIPIIYIAYNRRLGFKLMATYMFSMYINQVFKYWFMLPRPSHSLWITEGYGFPSGHSQASSTFWSCLALNTKLKITKLIAIVLPLLIAYSRLYLQVHYLIDVISGLLLGYGLPLTIHVLKIPKGIAEVGIHIVYIGCSLLMVSTSTIIPGGYGYIPIVSGSFLGAYVGYRFSERLKANIIRLTSRVIVVILVLTVSIIGYTTAAMLIRELLISYIVSIVFTAIVFLMPYLYLKLNL